MAIRAGQAYTLWGTEGRGIKDVFAACVDGLAGFPDAIAAVFPKTQVQLCIVHRVRNSLRFVSWKGRKLIAADLKKIYQSITVAEAEKELGAFAQAWDSKYPSISQSWPNLIAFLIILMKSGRSFIPLTPLNPSTALGRRPTPEKYSLMTNRQ